MVGAVGGGVGVVGGVVGVVGGVVGGVSGAVGVVGGVVGGVGGVVGGVSAHHRDVGIVGRHEAMTKSTYNATADMIAGTAAPSPGQPSPNVTLSAAQRTMIAQRLAVMFKQDSSHFDTTRFLLACGLSAEMADVLDDLARRQKVQSKASGR